MMQEIFQKSDNSSDENWAKELKKWKENPINAHTQRVDGINNGI